MTCPWLILTDREHRLLWDSSNVLIWTEYSQADRWVLVDLWCWVPTKIFIPSRWGKACVRILQQPWLSFEANPELHVIYVCFHFYFRGNRFFCFATWTGLAVPCLAPAIDLMLMIDSYWVIGSTRYGYYWYFLQYFNVFRVVVLEKVRHELRSAARLHVRQKS